MFWFLRISKFTWTGGSNLGQRPFLDEAKKTRFEVLQGQREACYHFARESSEQERLEDNTLISVDDSLRTDAGVSAPPRQPRCTTHTSAAKAPTQNLWVFSNCSFAPAIEKCLGCLIASVS